MSERKPKFMSVAARCKESRTRFNACVKKFEAEEPKDFEPADYFGAIEHFLEAAHRARNDNKMRLQVCDIVLLPLRIPLLSAFGTIGEARFIFFGTMLLWTP